MVPKFLKVLNREGYPLLISLTRIISMREYEDESGKHFVSMVVIGVNNNINFDLDTTIKAIELQLAELEVGVNLNV